MVGGADFFLEIVGIEDTDVSKKITISDGKGTYSLSFHDFYTMMAQDLKIKETGTYQIESDIN
jgi:hypothetical protein